MPQRPDPTWVPRDLDDLRSASANGLLTEGHHLDLKRELGSGASANRNAAKDMASLAIDGGLLIYGVDEDTEPPSVTCTPLAGLAERLEQIALTAVEPPLHVKTRVLADPSQSDSGCVVVLVPPGPAAPYMVDGRYQGRADKTNHALSDAEVVRLHSLRTDATADAMAEVRRDLL